VRKLYSILAKIYKPQLTCEKPVSVWTPDSALDSVWTEFEFEF